MLGLSGVVYSSLSYLLSVCVCLSFPSYLFSYNFLLLFTHSEVSDSLWPHRQQHTKHRFTVSRSLLKLTSIESIIPSNYLIHCWPPSPPAPNVSQHQSLSVSQLFPSGGQSIGASASASVLPMNIQDWFSLGLTGLIFLLSKGLSRIFSSITVQKHHFFGTQPTLQPNYLYTTTGKTIVLTIKTFVSKVMSLLFNMLSSLS